MANKQRKDGMTGKDWREVKRVFSLAVGLDPSHRSKFVSVEAGEHEQVRREVESLLEAYGSTEGFLENPAAEEVAEEILSGDSMLTPGESFGNYRIKEEIGSGGMGTVYLASDQRLDRDVAIKVLSSQIVDDDMRLGRFLREAKLASKLNHPNVMTVHEVGEYDGVHFISCEFIAGRTLNAYIEEEDLSVLDALKLVVQITKALASAHKFGIVHRDIKPDNIMVRSDGFAKVLDFGLAKVVARRAGAANVGTANIVSTQRGLILGTIAYMSPEQARGKPTDARSDLWSLGVILYQILTGRLPFDGDTASDVLASILRNEPPGIEGHVPKPISKVVEKALQKTPEKRYQTAEEFLEDLKQARQSLEGAEIEPLSAWQIDAHGATAAETDEDRTAPTAGRFSALLGRVGVFTSRSIRVRNPALLPIIALLSVVIGAAAYSLLMPASEGHVFENAKVADPAGSAGDNFGSAVAIEGNIMIVGSGLDDDDGINSGSALFFEYVEDDWRLRAKLKPDGEGRALSGFGRSVVISGDYALIGAPHYDNPAFKEGAAYVFVRKGGKWQQAQMLFPSDPQIGAAFGGDVALEGTTAVIGETSGSVYVFEKRAAAWEEVQRITSPENALGENDQFGQSVALSGDRIVIGAQYHDTAGKESSGSAYVFERKAGIWEFEQKITASDGTAGDRFGASVAVSDDSVFVGAPDKDVGGSLDQGSAYVFERRGNTWTEVKKINASDGAAGDRFGGGIAVDGETLVVSAHFDELEKGVRQGSAYVFQRGSSGGNWIQSAKLAASDGDDQDLFGYGGLSVSGDRVVIGASEDRVGGMTGRGSAFIFSLSDPINSPSARTDASRPVAVPGETKRLKVERADFARVILDGSGSFDPEGGPLTYTWSGPFETVTGQKLPVTLPLGWNEVTLSVEDGQGEVGSAIVSYEVRYPFTGFFEPIDDVRMNVVKAGSTVPMGFSLDHDYGTDIVPDGFPHSHEITCRGKETSNDKIVVFPVDKELLTFDALTRRYTLYWKTEEEWAGTCRHFALKLKDGSAHTVFFKFE